MQELNLSKEEARNIAKFIEDSLLTFIIDFNGTDNFFWIKSMINAYDKLKEYSGFVGIYDPIEEGDK